MAIYPIEVLLNTTENREAYELLSNEYDRFIPYVGTGVSNYCKGWGIPFKTIMEGLKSSNFAKNCFYRDLNEVEHLHATEVIGRLRDVTKSKEEYDVGPYLYDYCQYVIKIINEYSDDEDKIKVELPQKNEEKGDTPIWDWLESIYVNEQYLELGELLNIISYTLTGEFFDLLFFRKINSYRDKAEQLLDRDKKRIFTLRTLDNKNPLPPGAWYLAYLGKEEKIVITTNTDDTLQEIYKCVGMDKRNPIIYSGFDSIDDVERTRKEYEVVYHIHGLQPEKGINSSETFIMTWSDYKKQYEKENGSSLEMLNSLFINGHFLFIGASLNKDITVEKMKKRAKNRRAYDLHVAFFKEEETSKFKNKVTSLKNSMATQYLLFPDYDSYSNVLCQLVREKRNSNWAVYKKIIYCEHKVDDDLLKKIQDFLEADEAYAVFDDAEFTEENLENNLYPALRNQISKDEQRTYQWAICRIDDDDFAFPIDISKDYALDTYSAPLGNTIYIVGGNQCSDASVNLLVKNIEKWAIYHDNGYWSNPVKVRVFLVKNTDMVFLNRILESIESILNLDKRGAVEALKKLLDIIGQNGKYHIILKDMIDKGFTMLMLNENTVFLYVAMLLIMLNAHVLFQDYRRQIKVLSELTKKRMDDSQMTEEYTTSKTLSLSQNSD